MNIFKRIILTLAGSCILLSGCGGTNEGGSKSSASADSELTAASSDVIYEENDTIDDTAITTAAQTTSVTSTATTTETTTTTEPETTSFALTTEAPSTTSAAAEDIAESTAAAAEKTTAAAKTTKVTAAVTTSSEKTAELKYARIIDKMTLRQKVCQMFIATPELMVKSSSMITSLDDRFEKYLKKDPIGGVILFADNITSSEQITKMNKAFQKYSKEGCGMGMFISVDEEGGSVARVAQKLGTTYLYGMQFYGSEADEELGYEIGEILGEDISQFGFNLDFAPVADVNIDPHNELGNRIFSSDPQIVSVMTSGVVKGLQDNNVSATLKHFPGLGAAGGNTHDDRKVYISRTLDQLRKTEFKAFSGGIKAGADFVMVGHQILSEIDNEHPADMSYKIVTELLRKELKFSGIAITDSQKMNTISEMYDPGKAAVMSIKAGIDMILMPKDLDAAIDAVCSAVEEGKISEERINKSVNRILAVKDKRGLIPDSMKK